MNAIIESTLDATPSVIDRVAEELPSGFPARIFETIAGGLRRASQTLK